MGWLAAFLALWTAIASVAPVVTASCESPRCTCCARDTNEDPSLQRPPCCKRDDASRASATPVLAPRAGRSDDVVPALVEVDRPRVTPARIATAFVGPSRHARGPPRLARHLELGRLLL